MLHADGPQGGAINLHRVREHHGQLRGADPFGLTSAKDRRFKEMTGARTTPAGRVFIASTSASVAVTPSVITCGVKLLSTNQQLS